MTREDIEKMRAMDPEFVGALEAGVVIKPPKHLEVFHQYQKLDNEAKLKLYNLITSDLYNTGILEDHIDVVDKFGM